MISKVQIHGLKDAKKLAKERGHDLHPFPPFFSKLVDGTSTACRVCGRKVTIQIKRQRLSGDGYDANISGLAISEDCAPGSVKV